MESFYDTDPEFCEWLFRHHDQRLELRMHVMESGFTNRRVRCDHDHPNPPFARLFAFAAGGAEITFGPRHEIQRLQPGKLYLLPPGLSFFVRYDISQLIYHHLNITSATGRPVFSGCSEILEYDSPSSFTLLERGCFEQSHFAMLAGLTGAVHHWLTPRLDELADEARRIHGFVDLFRTIRNTPPGRISIKELGELYQITPDALSKRFKKQFGRSLKTFLQEQFILRAQELLLHCDLPINAVSEQLGCSDVHYFQRLYKQRTNQTPSAFRLSFHEKRK